MIHIGWSDLLDIGQVQEISVVRNVTTKCYNENLNSATDKDWIISNNMAYILWLRFEALIT